MERTLSLVVSPFVEEGGGGRGEKKRGIDRSGWVDEWVEEGEREGGPVETNR